MIDFKVILLKSLLIFEIYAKIYIRIIFGLSLSRLNRFKLNLDLKYKIKIRLDQIFIRQIIVQYQDFKGIEMRL